MPSHKAFALLSFICTLFPSVVLAKGGGRGGGGDGDSIASFFLEPLDATIFAFCVIFGVFTALQAIQAARNIYQRLSKKPPSITLPEFSIGPIFPTLLLLATLALTITYVLYAVYFGVTNNQNVSPVDIPDFSNVYFNAWNTMSYLSSIFLVAGVLALLSHRERILITTSPVVRDIKMIVEAVLTVILLALGMGRVGLLGTSEALSDSDIQTSFNIYIAFTSFFFVAAVDIMVSSIVLYVRARRSPVNDHKIVLLTAFVISPLLIIYALYPIILLRIEIPSTNIASKQVRLAGLIISCITEFGIIATCLRFGMPVIPKPKKAQNS